MWKWISGPWGMTYSKGALEGLLDGSLKGSGGGRLAESSKVCTDKAVRARGQIIDVL